MGPGCCSSNKVSGDADAAGLRTTLPTVMIRPPKPGLLERLLALLTQSWFQAQRSVILRSWAPAAWEELRGQVEVRSRCRTFRGFFSYSENHQLLVSVKLGLRESPTG